jgi:hypothetical protein
MSVFPPAPSAPSAPSTVCLSLSLWWRPEVVGRAGVGRYLGSHVKSITSPHLTSPPHLTSLDLDPTRPRGTASCILCCTLEASYLHSSDRTPAADRPNTPPHMSNPRPSLHSLRCASTCSPVPRLANSRSGGPSLQTGTWLTTPHPLYFSSILSHARQSSPCSGTQQRNQVSDTKARILSCKDSCAMTR